jgi:hypothetical protein
MSAFLRPVSYYVADLYKQKEGDVEKFCLDFGCIQGETLRFVRVVGLLILLLSV